MAETETQTKITERLAELPDDVREAILSSEFEKKVQAIGARHQLHIDQVGKLGDETMLVMLGFTNTADFVGNVAEHVGVSREQASTVATDINNDILGAIRESLKKFSEQPAPPASSTPPAVASVSVTPATPPTTTPKPPMPLAPHPHDLMLTEKTVTAPATPLASGEATTPAPQKPVGYKADPYREPPEL